MRYLHRIALVILMVLGCSPAFSESFKVAIILPMTGHLASNGQITTLMTGEDTRSELGLGNMELLAFDSQSNCNTSVQLTERAISEGVFAIASQGCDEGNVVNAVKNGILFFDVGAVSPERSALGENPSSKEQMLFLQLGFDKLVFRQPIEAHESIDDPSSPLSRWVQVPNSCATPMPEMEQLPPGSMCFDAKTTEQANRIMTKFEPQPTDHDLLMIAALQVIAAIHHDPDSYFNQNSLAVTTVFGNLDFGSKTSVMFPLQFQIDADAATPQDIGTMDGMIARLCPDCAGSTKICGTTCPDECNNSCTKEGNKQCCNKSGMPAPAR